MSVFNDFKLDVVIDVVCRHKVDSLAPLLLAFIDLLADVRHTVCIVWYIAGGRGLVVVRKGG